MKVVLLPSHHQRNLVLLPSKFCTVRLAVLASYSMYVAMCNAMYTKQ